MEVKVRSRYLKMSPHKIRVLRPLIFRQSLETVLAQMKLHPRRAANPIYSLAKNAVSIVKDKGLSLADFKVKEFKIDEGPKLKRFRPGARGRAQRFTRRMSHLTLVISDEKREKKDGTKS